MSAVAPDDQAAVPLMQVGHLVFHINEWELVVGGVVQVFELLY
jgi:hypothetical protein